MEEFLEYRVADVMAYRPITIGRHTCLAEAIFLFEERDFNALPVSEDGCLVGVLTTLDLLKAFAFTPGTMVPPYEQILRQPAEAVMSQSPETVSPDLPLTALLQKIVVTGRRSFPVTIGALLVGMVAREDVMRALRWAAAGEGPRGEREPVRRRPAEAPTRVAL
jgi:CBS domain-containing protein